MNLKENTKSILSEVNKILNIEDSYKAPDRVLRLLLNDDKESRSDVFYQSAKLFSFDFSRDWFWEYFQEEHADRHQNKQDFTPQCISAIITRCFGLKQNNASIVYEPAAGTGQMIIRNWEETRHGQKPWEYLPSEHLYICSEISIKTIPFLLFNLAVRGICAVVYRMDSMTKQVFDIYTVTNSSDSALSYSEVQEVDLTSSDGKFYLSLMQ